MKTFLGYLLCSLFYFFPNPLRILSHIPGLSEWPEDTHGVLYRFWRAGHALDSSYATGMNPFVGAPFGLSEGSGLENVAPVFSGLVGLLSLCLNEILSYNLFCVLGVALSAWAASKLAGEITGDRTGGLFAGFAFGFSPNLICHVYAGHLGYAHAQWMPLYALYLVRCLHKPNAKNGLITGLLFAVVWLSAPYLGYFTFLFTIIFLCCQIFPRAGAAAGSRRSWRWLTAGFLLAAVLIASLSAPVILVTLGLQEADNAWSYAFVRPLQDLYHYAGRLWDYLAPSELNPFFGSFSRRLYAWLGGRNIFERTLYLGWSCLTLAWVGLTGAGRKAGIAGTAVAPSLLTAGVLMMTVSFPPRLDLGFIKIPFPSLALYEFFPMFRVYARAGFWVTLALSVAAAAGVSRLAARFRSGWPRSLLAALLLGGLLLEYLLMPPLRQIDVSTVREHYRWLSNQPGDFILAEYPLYGSIDSRHYRYLSGQRFHKKRLMNGAPDMTPAGWLLKVNAEPWHKGTARRLSALGVRYVVFNKVYYRENLRQRMARAEGYTLVERFPDADIYEVRAEPADAAWIVGNIYPPERGLGSEHWGWMAGDGAFVFYKRTLGSAHFELEFNVTSFTVDREVRLVREGRELGRWGAKAGVSTRIKTGSQVLGPGLTSLAVKCDPGPLEDREGRAVSIAISGIQVTWDGDAGDMSVIEDHFLGPLMEKQRVEEK